MKKVLIIAYYFPPLGWSGVQRTFKYVKYLKEFGWEPVVITVGRTKFFIKDESLVDEIPNDIQIYRVDDTLFKPVTDEILDNLIKFIKPSLELLSGELKKEYNELLQNKMEQFRNTLLLPDGSAIWAKDVIEFIEKNNILSDISLIYTTSSPYSTHVVGYNIKKKYNLPWVADFRDEWTNNCYYNFDKEDFRFKLEKSMEEHIVNSADKVINISWLSSENYQKIFNVDKQKLLDITNGYDEEDFKNIECNVAKNKKFTVIHNGSFYLVRNPNNILIAINNLIENNKILKEDIYIKFIGICETTIKNMAEKYDKYNLIEWMGYLPHKESIELAINADLLLLIAGKGEKVKTVVTGKVFEYLRCGKPILCLSPHGSVVEDMLNESGHGINIEYEDVKSIEHSIYTQYNMWKNQEIKQMDMEVIKKYERKNLTEKLSRVFDSLV